MTLDHLDHDTRLSIVARRNFHFGLWAGAKLGRRDEALARYAFEVMAADEVVAGPDDVLDHVLRDLGEGGVPMSREQLAAQLVRVERAVRAELLATD
jgi:hypothetical protein